MDSAPPPFFPFAALRRAAPFPIAFPAILGRRSSSSSSPPSSSVTPSTWLSAIPTNSKTSSPPSSFSPAASPPTFSGANAPLPEFPFGVQLISSNLTLLDEPWPAFLIRSRAPAARVHPLPRSAPVSSTSPDFPVAFDIHVSARKHPPAPDTPAQNWGCEVAPPARFVPLHPGDPAAVAPSPGSSIPRWSFPPSPILCGQWRLPPPVFPPDKIDNRCQTPPTRTSHRSNQLPFEKLVAPHSGVSGPPPPRPCDSRPRSSRETLRPPSQSGSRPRRGLSLPGFPFPFQIHVALSRGFSAPASKPNTYLAESAPCWQASGKPPASRRNHQASRWFAWVRTPVHPPRSRTCSAASSSLQSAPPNPSECCGISPPHAISVLPPPGSPAGCSLSTARSRKSVLPSAQSRPLAPSPSAPTRSHSR